MYSSFAWSLITSPGIGVISGILPLIQSLTGRLYYQLFDCAQCLLSVNPLAITSPVYGRRVRLRAAEQRHRPADGAFRQLQTALVSRQAGCRAAAGLCGPPVSPV